MRHETSNPELSIMPDKIELFLFDLGRKWRSAHNNLQYYLKDNSQLSIPNMINNDIPIDFVSYMTTM